MSGDLGHAATALGDVISVGVIIGTISQVLPAIAAIMSIVWTLIRIFETQTVQRIIHRDRRED